MGSMAATLILELIASAFLSVLEMLATPGGEALLAHSAGKSRARTIRKYVRHCQRLQGWPALAFPALLSPGFIHGMHYVRLLFSEPCSRTVPRTALESVAFVAEKSGVVRTD